MDVTALIAGNRPASLPNGTPSSIGQMPAQPTRSAPPTEQDVTALIAGSRPPNLPNDTPRSTGRIEQAANLTAESLQTAGEAGVGYRAAMYGEVGVGQSGMKFGTHQKYGVIIDNSTLSSLKFGGYSIDKFGGYVTDEIGNETTTRSGERRIPRDSNFPLSKIISTDAQYDFARQQAQLNGIPRDQVRFEFRDSNIKVRKYDIQLGANTPYIEIKAGKTISPSQLLTDTRAAQNGAQIDYRFAENPVSGYHGPDPADARRLTATSAATNGNFTSSLIDNGPSAGQVRALEAASTVSYAARRFGRVAAPLGVAGDVIAIGSGMVADGGIGQKTAEAAAGAAGGWAGAAIGAWSGIKGGAIAGTVVGGPVMGAPIGAVVGGLSGAVAGGFFGGWGAEWAVQKAANPTTSPGAMIGNSIEVVNSDVLGD